MGRILPNFFFFFSVSFLMLGNAPREDYFNIYDSLSALPNYELDTSWSKANLQVAAYYFQDLQLDSAYPFIIETIESAEKVGSEKYWHEGKQYLVAYLIYRSNLDSAKTVAQQALLKNPKEPIKATYYSHLGVINYYQGNEFESLENYLKALKIDEEYSPEELSNSYSNIANLYLRQSDHQKARGYFQKALTMEKQKKDTLNMMVSYHNLLLLHFDQKNKDSIKHYFHLFREYRGYVDQDFYDDVLAYQTGHYYLAKEDKEKAIFYFDSARSLALARNNVAPFINASSFQAKLLIEKGELVKAEEITEEALSKAIENGVISMRKHLYQRLFEIEEKRGNFKKALNYFKQFKLYTDSANANKSNKQLNKLKYLRQLTENQRLEQQNNREKQKVAQAKQEVAQKNFQLILTLIFLTLLTILIVLLVKARRRNQINISKLKKSEESLKIKSIELDDYNKKLIELNELKNKLLSLLAHDLRSPLVGVLSTISLLKEDELNESEREFLMEELYNSVHNNLNGLDNLVKWARSQMEGLSVKPDPFEAEVLCLELKNELKTVFQNKGVQLLVKGDLTAIIEADKEMVKSALRNLLTNALKFSPKGKNVTLSIQATEDEVEFLVSDEGAGIPEERQKQIFHKPITSSSGTSGEKGSGIGLLLVKEFITLNGGEVSFVTEQNKGTTFKVSLPRNK